MKPLDPAPGSGHMRVNGHLPFSWKVLKEEEADRVRSQILDNAVARSWTVRPESHLNVSEEMGPLMRRLNEIEEKIDRLLLRLDRADAPPLPTRALTLGTESCILTALPDEVFPPDGQWAEIRFILPPHTEDEIVVLARSKGNGIFNFVLLAQDQMDHVVRYLLNRQRLAQEYPRL
jgi:hypothetical protein